MKGKSSKVSVYEVFDADPLNRREGKLSTKTAFEQALLLYNSQSFREAANLFEAVLRLNPDDKAAQIYLARCQDIQPIDINNYGRSQNTNTMVNDVGCRAFFSNPIPGGNPFYVSQLNQVLKNFEVNSSRIPTD